MRSERPSPAEFLAAMRLPASIGPQSFGPWSIERRSASESAMAMKGRKIEVGWPDYALLRRQTLGTLHHVPPGEVVMDDTLTELRKHLPIVMNARGRVLVSGLGIGCVVRGLLASPLVEKVDVIEIDLDVCRVIGTEFRGNPRVEIHLGDALSIGWPSDWRWDFAWHDIWCDGNAGLARLHVNLILTYRDRVDRQGAWGLPRTVKRMLEDTVEGFIR